MDKREQEPAPQDIDSVASQLRKKLESYQAKKTRVRFAIPHKIRFPLAWTLFFAVLGIIFQSVTARSFVFVDFFGANYLSWFSSFGNFSEAYNSGVPDLLALLFKEWYYFFFTGGLIALAWEVVYSIVYTEVRVEKKDLPV